MEKRILENFKKRNHAPCLMIKYPLKGNAEAFHLLKSLENQRYDLTAAQRR